MAAGDKGERGRPEDLGRRTSEGRHSVKLATGAKPKRSARQAVLQFLIHFYTGHKQISVF
jgi:hypothetical protein